MRGFIDKVIKSLPKLSDEQVKQILLEVSNEHKLLTAVIDSQPIGIVIVDEQWHIQQSNKAADRIIFAGNSDDSRAEDARIWEYISEPEIQEFIKKMASENRSNTSEEFTVTGFDGSARFLVVSLVPFVVDDDLHGNIIKIEDITTKRTKEIFQRRMENMAGLTNLAAGMAHEIKNPLGAISIHIQLIQKAIQKKRDSDGKLPDQKFLENHLDIVNEEIENLNKLVMDFLFAVRPVKADLRLIKPFDIFNNLNEFFKPEFARSKIKIECFQENEDTRVLIDEKLFREVLINIAGNALAAIKSKFPECSQEDITDEKDFPGKINFKSYVKQDKYVIEISDNGCGMDEETCSKIFEPYFTTKANGTGLGMTMAYKIIKEFNGDIIVKSEKDVGTNFMIILPVPQTETKLLK